ncbi:hypothetical protein [Paenibacillus larvae]|uniref:hypothetical protein n=1 Tax=Paenibacillus larvae TaxID=1464 RepID=UPI0026C31B2B
MNQQNMITQISMLETQDYTDEQIIQMFLAICCGAANTRRNYERAFNSSGNSFLINRFNRLPGRKWRLTNFP